MSSTVMVDLPAPDTKGVDPEPPQADHTHVQEGVRSRGGMRIRGRSVCKGGGGGKEEGRESDRGMVEPKRGRSGITLAELSEPRSLPTMQGAAQQPSSPMTNQTKPNRPAGLHLKAPTYCPIPQGLEARPEAQTHGC